MKPNFHEELDRNQAVRGSSDRAFGLWFALVFAILAASVLRSRPEARLASAAIAALFALAAILHPPLLAPMNRVWTRFGLLLGRVTNPIVTGILFFGVFTPMGWLMRLAGADPLRLKRDAAARSYWIDRDPPGPPPQSMANQF